MWLLRPPHQAVHLHAPPAPQLHGQDFGPTVGQNRPASGGSARQLRPDVEQSTRRAKRSHPRARYQGESHPEPALQEPPRRALQRPDDPLAAAPVRRARRRGHDPAAPGHHQHEHERPRLRPHPQGSPHHSRPRRQRPGAPAPHHGSHRLPQPRPLQLLQFVIIYFFTIKK